MSNKTPEEKYIRKRRLKARIYSLPFYLCRIFPIKKNKVVFWTLEGAGGYSCSPKYIAEELIRRNKSGQTNYELFWIVKDINKDFPSEIKRVRDTWLNRAFHMTTARFWIGNTRTFWGTKKRQGTSYIQTWHGSISLKPIGLYRGDKFSKIAYEVSNADSNMIDVAISGSKWCTEMWPKGLIYNGEINQLGIPRCDVLINQSEEKHREIREKYGLPLDSKIVIYAPTFRGGSQALERQVEGNSIHVEIDKVLASLEKRFGGVWYMFLRLHPQLAEIGLRPNVASTIHTVIDVTKAPDMSELMAATDAIITDYSTVVFEGFLTGQPGFIYADDLDAYVSDRGSLMFDMKDIPFPSARNMQELTDNILGFDKEEYLNKVKKFKNQTGMIEDGYASKKVVDMLEDTL